MYSRISIKYFFFLIISFCIVALFNSCNKKEKIITARDYYYSILPNSEFGTHIPDKNELRRISYHKIFAGKSLDYMKNIAENSTPDKILNLLLNDIIKNKPVGYSSDSDDFFAGIYPSFDFNARTMRSPNGGYLILVNYSLRKCMWEWGKLLFNIIFLKQANPELRPDDSMENITESFLKSVFNYAQYNTIPAFVKYATDEKAVLVSLLSISSMKYLLAHEYAHIVLGHIDTTFIDISKNINETLVSDNKFPQYYSKEIEADTIGAKFFLNSSSKNDFIMLDPEIKILGIYYCIATFEIVEIFRSINDSSYFEDLVQIQKRLESIEYFIRKNYAYKSSQMVNQGLMAINYLIQQSIKNASKYRVDQSKIVSSYLIDSILTSSIHKYNNEHINNSNNLSDVLDSRFSSSKKARDNTEFILFMRKYCEFKEKGNWRGQRKIAVSERNINDYFKILIDHAYSSSLLGVKECDLPWHPGQSLNSSGFVELALSLLASNQNKKKPEEAKLNTEQREKILFVWKNLYANTLVFAGLANEPKPIKQRLQPIQDYNISSIEIARLLQDQILMKFSVLAGAWAFERMDLKEESLKLKKTLDFDFEWPPITSKADMTFQISFPEKDYYGNLIPNSYEKIKK